jgi:hypothetical protein
MKRHIPAVLLLLFVGADAFLKNYAPAPKLPFLVLFLILSFYFLLYFRQNPPSCGAVMGSGNAPQQGKWWPVLLLLAFGTLFRFWRLDGLFDGVFWDEAYKGLDAIAIRQFGERPIFLTWNAGREALVSYLVASFTFLFRYTIFSVRAVEALAGVLTLLFFFLFVKRLFGYRIALLCLFLLAFSKYHIIYSRFGIRVNLILLFELATLYFVLRGIQEKQKEWLYLLLAGVAGGLGFYTYIAYRIFPVVCLTLLVDRDFRSAVLTKIKPLAAALLICLLIVAPLAVFFAKNARSFSDRMARTALWSKQKESLPVLLLRSAGHTTGMFSYKGDINPRHNVEAEPALSPFATAFFWLGVIASIANIRKRYALFLLLYFLFMITPGILGADAPHASRNLGALPPALLLTAAGICKTIGILRNSLGSLSRWLVAIIMAGVACTGPNDGLLRYSANLDAQDPAESALWGMNSAETDVANYIDRFSDDFDIYLSPQLFFHATVEYLARFPHRLYEPDTELVNGKMTFIVLQETPRNLWWLRDDDGKNFFKWWQQYYGYPVHSIRKEILRAYLSYPSMTRQSDHRLLALLRTRYPGGKLLRFDQFTVYLLRPQTSNP